ncbi:hypothetical protein OPT61_g1292 [Boeremia exigua]|uniref:Uncharacterized protein n=1 Tax=Boeremia exigua TaxID=749465 RepID=A0ACC2IQR2_9PLEO|nr:hypothetical protein OPT61_g1292 [Boeremia exigua]
MSLRDASVSPFDDIRRESIALQAEQRRVRSSSQLNYRDGANQFSENLSFHSHEDARQRSHLIQQQRQQGYARRQYGSQVTVLTANEHHAVLARQAERDNLLSQTLVYDTQRSRAPSSSATNTFEMLHTRPRWTPQVADRVERDMLLRQTARAGRMGRSAPSRSHQIERGNWHSY